MCFKTYFLSSIICTYNFYPLLFFIFFFLSFCLLLSSQSSCPVSVVSCPLSCCFVSKERVSFVALHVRSFLLVLLSFCTEYNKRWHQWNLKKGFAGLASRSVTSILFTRPKINMIWLQVTPLDASRCCSLSVKETNNLTNNLTRPSLGQKWNLLIAL